ncbi:MAG TPA: flagellar basal-body MS-ring/collar protein FliF [Burkholderiaceae bacterium]|nr:flagellar basal-body MS-ring/collar protein FliF [Burkholderiaceae bacterium]HMX09376.1 flagellar basal-body MS-ring/collar protein FliF [Burkholderiaceae bacterium]HMY98403.1 flagellar basal-body MS-ring/collar protein FliF [Burkholderiaceae bacterium]HNG78701.1 flagellar basal-body MS-ring/collar protein FliF [Burkholderiaceae bacterium]
MDNATLQPLTANTAAADAPPPGFLARLQALPMARKLLLGGGIAALLAVVITAVAMNTGTEYKVLFANLSDKDGGAVVAQLSQMNVPYKYTEGGTAVLVPAEKVHDVRLKLAQAGLPKGSTVGFELMDNARFGTTQFQERLNFQRGLEGELVRSITALAAVEAARVHLALPNQNGFFRDQQKPSASVLLTLRAGRSLDRAQLAGIVHLVSSSVPEMNPKAVSILDQTGALLSGPPEGMAGLNGPNGMDAQQLQYVNQIEAQYTKRILDILEPVVGRDNLRAQVSAEIDFSQTESTSEEFKPNQGGEPAAVRSAQTSESGAPGSNLPSGVPGAMSNQPPAPASAPINGQAQAMQGAQTGGNGAGGNLRREAVTNYEVDKTVRVTRAATGSIKRLSAAVVVNHRSTTDKKGNAQTLPLPQEEIDKLTALVQETVGFSKDRGDSVRVINAPFKPEKPAEDGTPFWKQPEMQQTLRQLAWPLALALVALIVVFGAIRPVLKEAAPKEPPKLVDAVVDDAQELPALGDGSTADGAGGLVPALAGPADDPMQKRLEEAKRLAKENPAAVANIVRGWVSRDA